jgi:hypothetical protein
MRDTKRRKMLLHNAAKGPSVLRQLLKCVQPALLSQASVPQQGARTRGHAELDAAVKKI